MLLNIYPYKDKVFQFIMRSYNNTNLAVSPQNTFFEYLFAKWVCEKFFTKPGKLCDIGSGNGSNALAFNKLGHKVVALDIDDFYFKRLESKNIECKKINFDKQKLPFKDNELDYIFLKSVLEHLSNPLAFLEEANRCLRPGGRIFILTPDWEKSHSIFYNDPTHKSPLTKSGLKKALVLTGFKIKLLRNFKNPPYIWRFIGTRDFDFTWFNPTEMMAIAEK